MKSRKIISLLSAAAMSASVFSGLALTAHAEDTVLWSDTFDLQSTKEKFVYREGSGPTTDAETIPGIMMSTTNRSGGDEGSYYSIAEKSTDDKYLNVGQTFFGDYLKNERWAHIDFINDQSEVTSFTATADTDIVIDFDMLMKDGVDAANSNATIDPVLRIGGFAGEKSLNDVIEISRDEEKIAENTWVDVRIIVTDEGATAYVNGTEATTNAAMTSIASIGFIVPDGTTTYNPTVEGAAPAEIGFDNVVVYSSDAGVTTATSAAPAATAQDPGTVTYETVPEPAAPEDLYLVASENFDSSTAGRVAHYSVSDYVYENVVATFMVGQTELENDAAGENNWTITTNTATDPDEGTNNYIAANNGRRSSGGRGPKMEFNYGEIAERETVVAQFATRLHSSDGQPAEMIFLGSDVVSSTTNNVAAPVAMITTDANADSEVYVCANPLTKGGANVMQVPDGQWITVKIEAYRSEGKTAGAKISVDVDGELKYIFGSEEEYANLQDDNRSGINTLPLISFRSGNASFYGNGNASNTSNDIDNISIYSSNEPEASAADGVTMTVNEDDQTVSLTATTAGSAVLVQASYNTAKVLSDINVVPVSITVDGIALSASGEGAQLNAFTRGDKFMVFDSLADLTPLCDAHTVVNGAEPVEPETYGITVTAPVNGTVTTDPSGSAEAGDTVTITASPAEGYEVDTITVTAADQSTVTVTDNKFTMPAQAVTVTVTFKEASTQPDDPDNEYAAALVHTGYITSGTSMGTAGVSVDTADGNELFNSWGGGSSGALYGQTAYAQFEFDDSAPTNNIASIDFTFTVTGASDDTQTRSINVYLMPANFPSLENATIESANLGSLLGSVSGSTSETKEFTFKITDPTVISDIMENKDQVIIGVSDRNKGGTLSGFNSQTPPTLTIVQGEQVTLTTKVDGTATAGVTVAIDGVNYVSNENGVISLYLPVGTHTYAVEGGTYEAISATNFNVAADTGYTADINLTVSTVVAVPDRALQTGVTQLHEVASTTAQGNSTVLLPTAAREGIGLPETLTADYTFTIDYDIYIPVNASISLGAQNADRLGTMFNFTADSEGKLTVTATESGSSTKTVSDALSAGKWYNVKVVHTTTTANDGNFTTGPMTITISDVDIETGTVGSAVATLSDIAARNNVNGDEARAYNSLNFSSVTGNVMLNNIYVYTADTATD